MTTPGKGSEDQRRTWKRWMGRNGLTDAKGRFVFSSIGERRYLSRVGLKDVNIGFLTLVEKNLIHFVHSRNSMVELLPETIRTLLNSTSGNVQESTPFESWTGPAGLELRIQSTHVWADLVQFFILEYHMNRMTLSDDGTAVFYNERDYLSEMGFTISEHDQLGDDILAIPSSQKCDLENRVHEFCLKIIMQANPTAQNNPLLFWVGLCLQTEEFGNQQRLEFIGGRLKDKLTMREKLEALVHYARVFILDFACLSWLRSDSVPQAWRTVISDWLDPSGWDWVNHGLPRPIHQKGDPADFAQPHWQAFKAHFEALHAQWLAKGSNSPIGVILELL
ncbi:hypothetical protein M413DRAFT_24780 [Hebeloma cylindrosporum]|uniref:Uncharacterized protein n=1 Tax=Hebeloma cylindrosporum TaxID=76867 RepID=A0A0C3CNI5_HEBCY|nr:hypothetical protein M413DRAFT_24780 [Hebeloma cylindrosporum h7]